MSLVFTEGSSLSVGYGASVLRHDLVANMCKMSASLLAMV